MTTTGRVRLAIVIASYNTRDALCACLDSLYETPPEHSYEIVVADNASTDGTVEMLRRDWPNVRLIEMGRNLGFASATNAAIRACDSELVLLLNSDTKIIPGSIDRLISVLERDPVAAAAGPRLIDDSGRVELSFGRMMSPWNEMHQKVLRLGIATNIPLLTRWLTHRTMSSHYPDWVSGACLLVYRSCGTDVGWLDERFFLYCEDVDFCAALRAEGHKILFTPEAEVIHSRGKSGAVNPVNTRTLYRQSQLTFYDKHYPQWTGCLRFYLSMRRQLPPT